MRQRNIKNSDEIIENCDYVVKEERQYFGKWNQLFKNNHNIYLEIGCGKGRYIYDLAKLHPENNYIGIEKFDNVLVRAIQKFELEEVSNVKLIKMDALELGKVFAENEIEDIYLNFSDPWPKEKHAKRRLSSEGFLDIYKVIMRNELIMKTDNIDLFNYSIESLKDSNFQLFDITNDLHALNIENVMTEYEERFSKKGVKINRLVAKYEKERD